MPIWTQLLQIFQLENAVYALAGSVSLILAAGAWKRTGAKLRSEREAEKDTLNSEVNTLKSQRIDQLSGMLADCRLQIDRITAALNAVEKELAKVRTENYIAQLRVQQLEQYILRNNLPLPPPNMIG